MDYYLIFGMVAVALIAIAGIYFKIVSDTKANQKPLNDLNINIIRLSESIDHMRENDVVRDKRIEKHGEEIDSLEKRVYETEHELSNHETRIKSIEKKIH